MSTLPLATVGMCYRRLDDYVCTRDRDHAAGHAAHMDSDGTVAASWADGDAAVTLHPISADGAMVHDS
jgi:hypothetical protein